MCIDYRKLNEVSKGDAFPMQSVDNALRLLPCMPYYAKLDLKSGYWQIPLSPRAQEASAFVTPWGQYKWKRMPFGLKAAPACFQRLMN